MTLDKMQFCCVSSGRFIMGSDKQLDTRAFDDEFPQRELNLPDFYMSRFPVTNQQFDTFVRTKGYDNQRYWTATGWDWKNKKNVNRPGEFGQPFTLPNHPVVGVSWYEALAFIRWLTERWKEQGVLPENMAVKLPSEAEWEKAARGGVDIPDKPQAVSMINIREDNSPPLQPNSDAKRIYPWGNDADPNLANYRDTGIGTTSAVGCFTNGASPYGCEEMSGNVWEWTRSLWGKDWEKPDFPYPYNPKDGREDLEANKNIYRVVRGGSFSHDDSNVRCALRHWYYPGSRNYRLGFRVVLSPSDSGL